MCISSCNTSTNNTKTAAQLLGDSSFDAVCFGGYRETSRDIVPSVEDLKEDLKILSAMNIKLLRTYNVTLKEIDHLLDAITQLKKVDKNYEMYIMLGVWIDCQNARTDHVNHAAESPNNDIEMEKAIHLANQYPDIIKMIAVGNEAMVKWAESYYVEPYIILKHVNHLQELKKQGKLPQDVWITSSDNFASWGGGGPEYHVPALKDLIHAVDFISLHTYPMHDTHYNPEFWKVPENEFELTIKEQADSALLRALVYAQHQYQNVINYMHHVGANKPVHIGETGWASFSNDLYGPNGSCANDEYKSGEYYKLMRNWTRKKGITCFYFEAFDEPWKDAQNPDGSENHFGFFNTNAQAKYAIWDLYDKGIFKGLTRGGKTISKTRNGSLDSLMKEVKSPPKNHKLSYHRAS